MFTIGIILIVVVVALYALWIYFTKNQQGVGAIENKGVQEFMIEVKGVYTPNVIKAKVGKPVKINFTRKESNSCSRFVVFSDFNIRKELPENKIVPITFTPDKAGVFAFTCDMGMYQGKLIVK